MPTTPLVDPMLFWTKAAAIGQIAGAVATAVAVIVSLWIVLSERREQMRFKVGRSLIIQHLADPYAVVSFQVTNTGLRSIRINNLGWRSGWWRWGPKWARFAWAIQMNDETGAGDRTPFDLEPGRSASMIIPIGRFMEPRPADLDMFGPRKLPIIGFRYPPLCGTLVTSLGTTKIVTIDPELKHSLKLALAGDAAALAIR